MAVVQLSIDQAVQIMYRLREFSDSYDKFTRVGTSRVREVDIKSDQKKKIDESMDTVERSSRSVREVVDNVEEATMQVLRQIEGFNEQDAMRKVDELASSVSKVEEVSVTKVF